MVTVVAEVEIHDGEYNNIQRWKYAAIVDVFNGHKVCVHISPLRNEWPSGYDCSQ